MMAASHSVQTLVQLGVLARNRDLQSQVSTKVLAFLLQNRQVFTCIRPLPIATVAASCHPLHVQ